MKQHQPARIAAILIFGMIIILHTLPVFGTEAAESEHTITLLPQFCNDQKLNDWFDSMDQNLPVSMEYVIFGEAPYGMEFTNPELIRKTVEALKTVEIGDLSETDPDCVSDAPGTGFSFEMDGGERISFTFMMGTFSWNNGPYYDIADFGDLSVVSEELKRIGNPDYLYAESPDGGFTVSYAETYQAGWEEEDHFFGGIRIYLEEENHVPFVSIARCEDASDAQAYLQELSPDDMKQELERFGLMITDQSDISDYEYYFGRITVPGICFTLKDAEAQELELLILAIPMVDNYLNKEHVMRLCAIYPKEEPQAQEEEPYTWYMYSDADSLQKQMNHVVEMAVRGLELDYMAAGKQDVQPGNTLEEFCNHEGLTAWLEQAGEEPPAELIYTSDSWHAITDPDKIQQVLEALKTVTIGEVSDDHVGGSGRQIFDFMDEDGETVTFMFFQDTFNWDGESYEVLDWGDLAGMDIASMED